MGDINRIYGWRFAVNSLEKKRTSIHFCLSSRIFVSSQDIANLAMEILEWKRHFIRLQTNTHYGQRKYQEYKNKKRAGPDQSWVIAENN